jgi:hypothetical protein
LGKIEPTSANTKPIQELLEKQVEDFIIAHPSNSKQVVQELPVVL